MGMDMDGRPAPIAAPLGLSSEVRREESERRTVASLWLELVDPAGLIIAAGTFTVAVLTAIACGWWL